MDRRQKPNTMTVSEHILRKVSEDKDLPLSTVRKIIEFQFKGASEAIKGPNNSIEIEGFGKFLINGYAIKKKIKILLAANKRRNREIGEIEDPYSEEGDKIHKNLAKKVFTAEIALEYLYDREEILEKAQKDDFMAGVVGRRKPHQKRRTVQVETRIRKEWEKRKRLKALKKSQKDE